MKPEFEEPKDFAWGVFKNAKGEDVRYGRLKPQGEPKGTLVIVPGFRECIEKYFEVIRGMAADGYDVWMMDWPGQGGSQRFIKSNPQKAHHEGYAAQIDTLNMFATTVVEKSGGPLMVMGHSMGAHTTLRYLKEHPGIFDSAVLTSPMVDINTGTLPKPLARQMARFAKAGGYLEKYIPAGTDWDEKKHAFKDNLVTSDAERFKVVPEIYRHKPELRIGDPTYGWVYHSFVSIDILNQEEYLKGITTPVLMQVSDNDKIVMRAAQDRACRLMPNCEKFETPGAKHEIWMERDSFRDVWKKKVGDFLAARVRGFAPAPKKPEPPAKPKAPGL